jgi:glycosyltransferase involved in cell wall biosynthesis
MASGAALPSVLHLSHFDEYGGAGRAAYRLHQGLRRSGARSRMLVGVKSSDDPDVAEHRRGLPDRVLNRLAYESGVQYAFLPSTRRLLRHRWVQEADVLQLANIHGGWLALPALPRLARGKRVVWCIHDMWSFTGHCGYSYGHDGWMTGCGNCPHLDAYPAVRRDATKINWHLKRAVYGRLDVTVVAPSTWLARLAGRSPLLERFDVRIIPYGVDTDLFAPYPRADARTRLGLELDESVVLVVGMEPRKGSTLIGTTIRVAEEQLGAPVTLLVAGSTENAEPPSGIRARLLGTLDEEAMRMAYCAADAYLLPTLHDNLPNTVIESLACATPVVATDVGGVGDLVEDGFNGFLRAADGTALGEALAVVLRSPTLREELGSHARARASDRFSLQAQASAYLDLYTRSKG